MLTSLPPVPPDAVEADARGASGLPPAATDGVAGVSLRPLVGSLLLGLGVLAAIGWWTFDPEAFGLFARDLDPWLLMAAVGTVVLRVVFGAWRLRHFSGGRIGWADGVRDQIVWDFFAYVTPSTVGGGPFAIAFIARDRQLPVGEATSVILFAMLVDQIWFALTIPALLLAALGLDVFPDVLGSVGAGALMLFFAGYLLWVLALAYGTLVRPDRLAKAVGWAFGLLLLRRFQERAANAMDEMQERSRTLRSQRAGFYAKGFAITLVPWVCRYLLAVFVIWSVVPDVDAVLVFARSAAMQLGALAVPTPGGAGGVEALYLLFLGPPIQPEALVAPTLLVWRILSYYVFLAAGFVLVARHLRQRRASKAAPPPSHLALGWTLPMTEPEPVKRTSEIEEWTNRVLIHPMSRALVTVLARRAVSPNAVSLVGLTFGAAAAVAYLDYAAPPMVLVAFVLMIGWHVMDGADGQLARLTGRTSEIGRALDGLADHGTFVLVYLALAVAASAAQGAWVWIWAVAAGASHAVQASTYEAQRYAYDFWVQGKASARVPTPDEARAEMAGATGAAWALGQLNLLYLTVQHRTGASDNPVQRRLDVQAREPGGTARVAQAYRATHLAGVRRWNLLCSNYRTVAIAVACLVGSPVFFFAFEAVALNVVFVGLLAMTRRNDRALLARLEVE